MDYFWIRTLLHYSMHLIFPLGIAYLLFPGNWKKAYFIMLGTMLVDADHLLSTPMFSAHRSSINFHPLHTYWAIGFYFLLLFFRGVPRMIGVGLLFHMFTDWIDSLWL